MVWSTPSNVCLLALLGWPLSTAVLADEPNKTDATPVVADPIREYRSAHLHVRTDLPAAEAEALFERMEQTLRFASRYWGRKPRGQITCFVVHDLSVWTDAQLPHRLSRVIINGVGGATVPKMVGQGSQSRNRPTVFASSQRGVVEHELVHAYCIQTLGSTGPEWYKEGMAEMVVNRSSRESGIQCSVKQSTTLRAGEATSLATILGTGSTGKRIFTSLRRLLDDPANQGRHVPANLWTEVDAANVSQARDEYLHSWAFCYMMLHNPNYSKRFRSFGNLMIAEQRDVFDDFFAPVRDKIEFEHRLFLQNASVGYRVDLCSWDWRSGFRTLAAGESQKVSITARKGFQASGVTVSSGQRYDYLAEGSWLLSADAPPCDANGHADRSGQLIGVVLQDGGLSEPFPLGSGGTLQPATSGKLYLRCRDAWNEIADNSGQIKVTISHP